MRQFLASVLEVLEIVVVAVLAVFLIRNFLIQPFLVSGDSMYPSFKNGDYLLVDELTYRFRVPERGEVVVFRYPNDPATYFVKRIIGLPGEKLDITNGEVTVFNQSHPQGFVLGETYLPKGTVTSGSEVFNLTAEQYLVLGDNRSYSFDSRSWGPMPSKDLIGLVRIRLWPLDEVTAFAAPQYPQ